MRFVRSHRYLHLVLPGTLLFGLGGCLGPNPGFFISSSVANATIMNLVNAFLRNILALGGAA